MVDRIFNYKIFYFLLIVALMLILGVMLPIRLLSVYGNNQVMLAFRTGIYPDLMLGLMYFLLFVFVYSLVYTIVRWNNPYCIKLTPKQLEEYLDVIVEQMVKHEDASKSD